MANRRRGPRPLVIAFFAIALAVCVVLGALYWRPIVAAVAPGASASGSSSPSGAPATATASGPAQLPDVLPADVPASPPAAGPLSTRLAQISRKGIGSIGAALIDPTSGKAIYGERADTLMLPASNLKVLTCLAALDAYGAGHQFRTKVVSPAPGRIVLVGGGDPYLTSNRNPYYPKRATLADLAEQTAAALRNSGTKRVQLGFDASLFPGAGWNPTWPEHYITEVGPTSALWVDEGKLPQDRRSTDPALDAAKAFAAALRARGISVPVVARQAAPAGAAPVAQVASTPLDVIIQQVLIYSDNDAAEVLLRHLGLAAGKPGSIASGTQALTDRLTKLSLWHAGSRIADGSGLSRGNRVTPSMLANAFRLAFATDRYRPLLTALPVAGVEGTLSARFDDPSENPGRGMIRAKTGYLNGIHGLSGYLRTADGSVVVFALLINGPGENAQSGRDWLDRTTSAVVQCGCR